MKKTFVKLHGFALVAMPQLFFFTTKTQRAQRCAKKKDFVKLRGFVLLWQKLLIGVFTHTLLIHYPYYIHAIHTIV